MNRWCFICSSFSPCIHNDSKLKEDRQKDFEVFSRRYHAELAKRNKTWETASEAERSESAHIAYAEEVSEREKREREESAGWPFPDPELQSDAGWRRPIGPATPKAPRKPLRKPAMNLWEVRSRFKVGSSHILIPNSKLAAAIAESAANYTLAVNEQHGFQAFMVLESQQQSSVTAHAEIAFNRIVEARWPTLQFSDLKPISVPFGRRGTTQNRRN